MKVHIHNRTFPVILDEDPEGGFVVTNPAFEGCYSQGDTIEVALTNIRDVTLLCLKGVPNDVSG